MAMISIHNMSFQDLPAIHDINQRSFSQAWSYQAIQDEFFNEFAHYLVAKIKDQAVGFIGAWLVLDEVQITNIAVDPSLRRMGIAKALIDQLIKAMKIRQMAVIYLEVHVSNFAAIELYESFGFTNSGRRKGFYSDGEDAFIMALSLKERS